MLDLTVDEVRNLPVDELGLAVLADLIERGEWNEESYIHFVTKHYDTNQIALPVMEALAWLRSRGLTMPDARQTASTAIAVTRYGRQVNDAGPQVFHATEQLQAGLHPIIEDVARPQFLLGKYELAVFASIRAVEIRVRALAGLTDADFGVDLMNRAFGPTGPLIDPEQQGGEQNGTRSLFVAAYAVFRNPSGHREVDFNDVTEAAEIVGTASLLMRMLDRVEARLQGPVA